MHEESAENNGIIKDIIHGIVSNINKESNDDRKYSDVTLKELYSLSQLSKSNEKVIVEPENIGKASLLPLKNGKISIKHIIYHIPQLSIFPFPINDMSAFFSIPIC